MVRVSEFILNFVLNASWQIVVIAAVAALGSLLLKNAPARFRHTLWVFALAACFFVPLLTATDFLPHSLPSFQSVATASRVTSSPRIEDGSPVTTALSVPEPQSNDLLTKRSQPINTTANTALFLAVAYLLLVAGRAIRLARFWQRKERLRNSASLQALPLEIELLAERCRRLLGIAKVRVTGSQEARAPYTLGARRPLIVLPAAFCAGTDEDKLLSVIGHEMAHVKRRDFLSNVFCELLVLPLSFHPLVFLIKRQIDRARELACDELVTRDVLEPRVYARSLLWAADVTQQQAAEAFMLSIFDGKILEERIVRLMRNKRRVGAGPARVLLSVTLLILGGAALMLSLFSLELQTAVQASVIDPVQRLSVAVTETPASANSPTVNNTPSHPRTEPQSNASSAQERAMAACSSGRNGATEAIPSLIAMLADDARTELIRCWDTGRWSPALQTFKHPSPGEQAAIALASFGSRSFVPLMGQLSSSNAVVRRNAAWAIGELTNMLPGQRSTAGPQLISLLRDPDEWVRMAAARSLGELRDSRALDQLVGNLSDENWRVRELTVWALAEMKDERAVTALCSVLLADARVEVRLGAAEALGEIASRDALPSLKQALNDAPVSAKAAWAISEIEG